MRWTGDPTICFHATTRKADGDGGPRQGEVEVDRQTLAAIDALKAKFGARDDGEVLTKALKLAQLASEQADANGDLTIVSGNGVTTKVALGR